MTSRTLRSPGDIEALATFLRGRKLPMTITIASGRPRSTDQNKLQRKWLSEIAEQDDSGESTEHWRGFCKAMFGVPIRCRDDDEFRRMYDEKVRPLPHQLKLALMQEPFDLAVTRDMRVDQKREYLDAMYRHFTQAGFILTEPEREKA